MALNFIKNHDICPTYNTFLSHPIALQFSKTYLSNFFEPRKNQNPYRFLSSNFRQLIFSMESMLNMDSMIYVAYRMLFCSIKAEIIFQLNSQNEIYFFFHPNYFHRFKHSCDFGKMLKPDRVFLNQDVL